MKNACIVAGIALLLAMLILPYGFYPLLRWLVFIVSIYTAYTFYIAKLPAWTFVFGAVGFLFNPILPIYLSKASWIPLDFIAAVLFFIAAHSIKKKQEV